MKCTCSAKSYRIGMHHDRDCPLWFVFDPDSGKRRRERLAGKYVDPDQVLKETGQTVEYWRWKGVPGKPLSRESVIPPRNTIPPRTPFGPTGL
jgi:hypothetical protein